MITTNVYQTSAASINKLLVELFTYKDIQEGNWLSSPTGKTLNQIGHLCVNRIWITLQNVRSYRGADTITALYLIKRKVNLKLSKVLKYQMFSCFLVPWNLILTLLSVNGLLQPFCKYVLTVQSDTSFSKGVYQLRSLLIIFKMVCDF